MASRLRLAVVCLAALGSLGCALVDGRASRKVTLAKVVPPPDSVTLEVFLAGVSADRAFHDALWRQIDEQKLPADLRRELAHNGFRVGIAGSHMPIELARVLKLTDKPEPNDQAAEVPVEEPTLSVRVLQTRAGHRAEIQPAPHLYEKLPLLVRENGLLSGRSFEKAEARLALRAYPDLAGGARLELVPELEHGEQKQQWVGQDGVMRLDAARPKKVFEHLALAATLAPGEVLVMTSLPERPGSAGHYFFNQPAGAGQPLQKLLVIRLAQAGPDPHFNEEPTETVDLLIE